MAPAQIPGAGNRKFDAKPPRIAHKPQQTALPIKPESNEFHVLQRIAAAKDRDFQSDSMIYVLFVNDALRSSIMKKAARIIRAAMGHSHTRA
ncbi:MAG TPA: hypothetical protein VGN04_17185 [Herbaspirillum sp.]|jgi:hypothetical protein